MFDEQTEAFERLVIMGKFPRDHKQQKGYDYITDLKAELRKQEQKGKQIEKDVEKNVGKRAGKLKPVKPRTPKVGKVPTPVDVLLKNKKPTEWIVDSFGAKGAAVLLAGDKGSGKSAFCYRLAEAVSKGDVFLEQLETVQSKVLVWQADESQTNALDKIDHMGITGGFDFVFESDEGWDELDIPRLRIHLQQGRYGVLLIDSVTGLLMSKGISIKDPEFSTPIKQLNDLAGELGILIVLNCHLTKEDRSEVNAKDILGAGTQSAAASDIWGIWNPDEKDLESFTMKCLGKRNCDKNTMWYLQGNIEDFSFRLVSVGEHDLLPDKQKQYSFKFLDHLHKTDRGMTVKELADHFGCTEEHARRVCIKLKRQDQIERIKQTIKLGRPLYVYVAKTFPTSGI